MKHWNRPSRLFMLLAFLLLVAMALAFAYPTDSLLAFAIKTYSRRGIVTYEGNQIALAAIGRMRLALIGMTIAAISSAYVLHIAEQAMDYSNLIKSTLEKAEVKGDTQSWALNNTIVLISLACLIRLAIGLTHAQDSLSHDELYTYKHYANQSLAVILGVTGENSVNNHVLNSLLLKLSILIHWTSESGLRIWHICASVAVVLVAYVLGTTLKFKRWAIWMFVLLVATSPVIDFYGTQIRGYVFAIFLSALSITIHLRCLLYLEIKKLWLLPIVNALLLLSNIATFPLIVAEVLHLVIEALYSKSHTRIRGYLYYNQHIMHLIAGMIIGAGIQAFLFPYFLRDSIQFAYKGPISFDKVLWLCSGVLSTTGSAIVGAILISAVLISFSILKKGTIESSYTLAICLVVFCGLAMSVVSRVFDLRAIAYLCVPSLAIFILLLDQFGKRYFNNSSHDFVLGSVVLICFLSALAWGAFASVKRLPLQNVRGAVQEAKLLANNRLIWSSGFSGGSVDYYAKLPLLSQLPDEPSIFISFSETDHTGIRDLVVRRCNLIKRLPSEAEVAIYVCPPNR